MSSRTPDLVEVLRYAAQYPRQAHWALVPATSGRKDPETGRRALGQADLLAWRFDELGMPREARLAVVQRIFGSGLDGGPIASFLDLSMAQAAALIDVLLTDDRRGFTPQARDLLMGLWRDMQLERVEAA